MIVDITNEVYDIIKKALPNVTVLQEFPETTPEFPCVIVSDDGYTSEPDTYDTSGEHYNMGTLTFDIFSNKKNKISECKGIRTDIDTIMSGTYGMERSFDDATPNYLDSRIYRRTLKYDFKIDKDKNIYRR